MNKLTISFLIYLTFLGLISCTPDVAEIKTVNFDSLKPDPSKGITVKQSDEFVELIQRLQKENTLNRQLKKTPINGIDGRKCFLSDVLKEKKSLLLIGSDNCQFSKKCFIENIPKIIDSLESLNVNTRLIKLVINESDSLNFEEQNSRFTEYLNNSKSLYPEQTFIITRKAALELNIFGNTTIYFIENEVVKRIEHGASIDNPYERFDIIKNFFSAQ